MISNNVYRHIKSLSISIGKNNGLLTALATIVIAILTWRLTHLANEQWQVMKGQLDVMSSQIDEMRAENRPWISISMDMAGGLVHDAEGWHFRIKYSIRNVGKSPAADADFTAGMFPITDKSILERFSSGYSYMILGKTIHSDVDDICGIQSSLSYGRMLFPGNARSSQWDVVADTKNSGSAAGFIVIGCSTYKFVGDSKIHRSVEIFQLENSTYGETIDLSGLDIPMNGLAFYHYTPNGSSAD